MDLTPVFICLNEAGVTLAQRIQPVTGGEIHGLTSRVEIPVDAHFDEARQHIADVFLAGRPVVGLCAAGILIRAVAPFLQDKYAEPPVLAVDAQSVVPLLGGHHGANALACQVAELLQTHAAVTTATGVLALDTPPAGYRLVNHEDCKDVMARLANGAQAISTPGVEWLAMLKTNSTEHVRLTVSDAVTPPQAQELVYAPQQYVLGIGCARGASLADIREVAQEVISRGGISPHAIACIATIDLKADEAGINAYAQELSVPVRLFSASTLEAQTPHVTTPSDVVFQEVGCHSVSEAAALCGSHGALIVPKRKNARATAALAKARAPLTQLAGRTRGHVSVIGIGPGQSSWRTPEATRLIAQADELVGYGFYIDLLGSLAQGKPHTTFPLGAETQRCRYALEKAGEGKNVALICSGDAGIYAMASLVYEVLETDGSLSDGARRAQVYISPGVSALQAAAARIGAPLGHDFCTISLSDLLTPWVTIQQRIRAAGEGDFVIAFYNPVSQKRRTQLVWAKECLLQTRPKETPVVLGHSLGRPNERMEVTTLEALNVEDVDMMTVVLVGSSQTRTFQHGAQTRVYTPRGYKCA